MNLIKNMMNSTDFLNNADGFIRTYTGKSFSILSPNLDDIIIEDIAHALSLQCRWNGHINNFYSVAEHSIWCANHVDKKFKLAALLHDSAEAYTSDLPKPLKVKIAQFNEIEHNLLLAISKKFKFEYPFCECIHMIDKIALDYEWDNFVLTDSECESFKPFKKVERDFLKLFYNLTNNF